MFMILAAIPALAFVWSLGGRLSRLLDHEFRYFSLIWASLAAQIVLFTPLGGAIPSEAVKIAHIATYVPVLAFLALNRSAGLSILAVGATCNFVAIAANGGVMPADREASRLIFGADHGSGPQLNIDTSADNLVFLGDVMALPPWFPFANAFSIGDMLLATGIAWALARLTVTPPADATNTRDILTAAATTARSAGANLLAMLSAWAVIAVVIGEALTSSVRVTSPLALAAVSLVMMVPDRVWKGSSRTLASVACVVVALASLIVDVSSPTAAVVAMIAAAAIIRVARVNPEDGSHTIGAVVVRMAAAAVGLALGGAALTLIGPAPTLALLGVGLVGWAFIPHALEDTRPATAATSLPVDLVNPLAALTFACVSIGSAAVAAPLVGIQVLDLGAWSFGAIAALFVSGALAGRLMALHVVATTQWRAVGLMLVFAGMSLGLVASAHVPMTIMGAAVVLGASVGGARVLLDTWISPAVNAIGSFALLGGASMGAVAGADRASELLWASCIPVIAIGLSVAVLAARPRRVLNEVTA